MDNIHYVKEQDNLVPAGMTEFARDKTFGYKSSDLTEYVEEKTEGKYYKEDCITISLDELNALDVQGIKEKLMSAQNMAKIIVNAVSYADLKVFCAALELAMKEGKHYMARTAAAFTKVMGRISDQPLLGREQLEGDTKNGGIVLIGSHVKKTTDQLNCLKELDGQADFMEFQVNTVFEESSRGENPVWKNRCNLYKQTASCAGEYDSGGETADFCKDFQRSDQYYRKAFCEAEIYHCKRRNHFI